MDLKLLYDIMQQERSGKPIEKSYWDTLWNQYIAEKNGDYQVEKLQVTIPRMISEHNFRQRRVANNCKELGVRIKLGDICYVDFGEAYINEIGYQHFALIVSLFHNKAFVIPMSGNHNAYLQAYSKTNPNGKKHLMRFGKMKGMNKESVLFINDAKWINTARIIDVKAHLSIKCSLFQEIKARVIFTLG